MNMRVFKEQATLFGYSPCRRQTRKNNKSTSFGRLTRQLLFDACTRQKMLQTTKLLKAGQVHPNIREVKNGQIPPLQPWCPRMPRQSCVRLTRHMEHYCAPSEFLGARAHGFTVAPLGKNLRFLSSGTDSPERKDVSAHLQASWSAWPWAPCSLLWAASLPWAQPPPTSLHYQIGHLWDGQKRTAWRGERLGCVAEVPQSVQNLGG